MFIDQLLDKNEESGKNDKTNKTRAAIACGIAGLVVGLMLGYSKKWNLFYSGAAGAVIGGMAGSLATPK